MPHFVGFNPAKEKERSFLVWATDKLVPPNTSLFWEDEMKGSLWSIVSNGQKVGYIDLDTRTVKINSINVPGWITALAQKFEERYKLQFTIHHPFE